MAVYDFSDVFVIAYFQLASGLQEIVLFAIGMSDTGSGTCSI